MSRIYAVVCVTTLTYISLHAFAYAESTQVLAISGEVVPGTTSVLSPGWNGLFLNDLGEVAFNAGQLNIKTHVDQSGIYIAQVGSLSQLAHIGQLSPNGVNQLGTLRPLQLTSQGQVVFVDSTNLNWYAGDGHTIKTLFQINQPVPGGGQWGIGANTPYNVQYNDSGEFAFYFGIKGAPGIFGGVFVSNGNQLVQVAKDGLIAPSGKVFAGVFNISPSINASGEVAFVASFEGDTSPLLLRFDGAKLHGARALRTRVSARRWDACSRGRFLVQ